MGLGLTCSGRNYQVRRFGSTRPVNPSICRILSAGHIGLTDMMLQRTAGEGLSGFASYTTASAESV